MCRLIRFRSTLRKWPEQRFVLDCYREQIPYAEDIQAVMNISRAMAYQLMHREYFPTIVIGKRMVVPRDKFLEWLEDSVGKR